MRRYISWFSRNAGRVLRLVLAAAALTGSAGSTAAQQPALAGLPHAVLGGQAALERAKHLGVRACAGQVKRLVDFFSTGVEIGTQEFATIPKDQDEDLFSMSMERTTSTALSFTSVDVAPVLTGQCAFAYQTVSYWPYSCDTAATNVYSGMSVEGVLLRNIRVLKEQQASLVRVYLMPAGKDGCVAIKREIAF
jgi:hypothetical protein